MISEEHVCTRVDARSQKGTSYTLVPPMSSSTARADPGPAKWGWLWWAQTLQSASQYWGSGVSWGTFTCVGWKVTLCDPMWHVTPRSSEMSCSGELYRLTF